MKRPGAPAPVPLTVQPLQPLQGAPGSPAEAGAPKVTPQAGPPGAEIRVVASGYGSCAEVGVTFNGTRIGSARPDAAGRVDRGGLSIPGGASPGQHSVGTSCLTSARRATPS